MATNLDYVDEDMDFEPGPMVRLTPRAINIIVLTVIVLGVLGAIFGAYFLASWITGPNPTPRETEGGDYAISAQY